MSSLLLKAISVTWTRMQQILPDKHDKHISAKKKKGDNIEILLNTVTMKLLSLNNSPSIVFLVHDC